MTKTEIYKNFTNLSEKELNTKNNKKAYVRNDVITIVIKRCGREKTRGIRAIDGFRIKLMIPGSEISKRPEFEVKLKIGKIFKNQNALEEQKKHQKKKLGCKFIKINTSNVKNSYDLDYEVGNVHTFIDEFKNKRTRKRYERESRKINEEKLEKELKDKNKELKNLTNNQ